MRNLLLVLSITFLYFTPTLLALVREVPHRGSVFVVNLFLGWTFVGWVVALAMASRTVERRNYDYS